MYTPSSFVESKLSKIHDVIERFSFATVVSDSGGAPMVTHMPLLLDRNRGTNGTLIGHFAAANPHAVEICNAPALAIFTGPHAYISPTWYDEKDTVPTWNYVAVHATGTARLIDEADLLQLVTDYVETYEADQPAPLEAGKRRQRIRPQAPRWHRWLRDRHRNTRGQVQAQPKPEPRAP